ncbi:hypothetical protein I316_07079 [Kwoniella heveanensis BCC8398]|uniref:Uncharacterized protein n=1 Tax=Kwoniella heveanensis BCC8398 TaxID=1296120 RepID=A0A1B9GK10_9TREE|nr:hypothetical protein I316_07079 [Kwoniella heveanensis BCC8398]
MSSHQPSTQDQASIRSSARPPKFRKSTSYYFSAAQVQAARNSDRRNGDTNVSVSSQPSREERSAVALSASSSTVHPFVHSNQAESAQSDDISGTRNHTASDGKSVGTAQGSAHQDPVSAFQEREKKPSLGAGRQDSSPPRS